jgi:uncharacterized protein YbbC (DUF1343 family)
MSNPTTPVRYGIDMLFPALQSQLSGKRVGMVTNNVATTGSAYSQRMIPSRVALQKAGVDLVALFAPEHGLGAAAMDGASIEDEVDPLTGAPVYSLYGDRYRPAAEQLAGLDLLLFDIPDVGARFYTYAWTLSHVMEACAEVDLPLWILDRPNPIGGNLRDAEGPMLDPSISTFVGRWDIPIRHSLTLGELAFLWRHEQKIPIDLNVIKANGWTRDMHWPETGNPFVPTSPSLPSYEAALIYPGTCLFEGTNLSEGRGTSTPFLHIGAPWVDAHALAARFNYHRLPGIVARAVHFIPTASKHAGETCHGVMLHAVDAKEVRPVWSGLHLLADVIHLHPAEFQWLPYPTSANAPGYGHIERLVGRLDVREVLLTQPSNLPQLLRQWTETPGWAERVRRFLMY